MGFLADMFCLSLLLFTYFRCLRASPSLRRGHEAVFLFYHKTCPPIKFAYNQLLCSSHLRSPSATILPSIPQKISLKKAVAHTENKEEPHTYRFQLQRGLRATKSSATYQARSKPYSTLDPHQITTEMRKQMKK